MFMYSTCDGPLDRWTVELPFEQVAHACHCLCVCAFVSVYQLSWALLLHVYVGRKVPFTACWALTMQRHLFSEMTDDPQSCALTTVNFNTVRCRGNIITFKFRILYISTYFLTSHNKTVEVNILLWLKF